MRYRTRLIVDLDLLSSNIADLKSLAPDSRMLLMVKANAYGHGLVPLVRFCTTELGMKEYGCATLGEAIKLREELSDLEFEIYVFSDLQLDVEGGPDLYLNRRIIPVISSATDLDLVLNNKSFKHLPLCLKFNTGMNRLGLDSDKLDVIIKRLKNKSISSIYHLISHLSSSFVGIEDGDINHRQYDLFRDIKKSFEASGITVERSSIANSGAIEQKFALKETHIRPGLMMYGPSTLDKEVRSRSVWSGKNISRLESYVINTFSVKKGSVIGYGATPVQEDGIIAMIAIGYGDGFATSYRGLKLKLGDLTGVVAGRVNMDMIQLYFPNEDKVPFGAGDKIDIWTNNADDILSIAEQTGAIPYEIFCHLNVRVPRIYRP